MNDIYVMITQTESEMVLKIARRIYRKYCPAGERGFFTLDDLKHYGIIGLIEAKRSYDPKRRVPWLKFAPYRIYGAILDEIRKAALIRLPQNVQEKVKAVKTAENKIICKGEIPTPEALARELGWQIEEVFEALALSPKLVSVADTWKDTEDTPKPGVVIPDPKDDPEGTFVRKELLDIFQKCLEKLSSKLRFIFNSRVLEDVKLKDLAATFGCSIESIRLRQGEAKAQLKECFQRHGWSKEDIKR